MSEPALNLSKLRDTDMLAARRTADLITHLLRDFIPDNCRRQAWDRIAEACLQEGYELTNKAMRKEYETIKTTLLETTPPILPRI